MRILKPVFILVLVLLGFSSYAQTPGDDLPGDPGAIAVYNMQDMKFGAFSVGAGGGSITVSTTGSRTSAGNIILMNLGFVFSQAIFDVEAPTGTIVSILKGPDITMTGSNGGSLTLSLGDTDPVAPFNSVVQPPGRTPVNVSGTLSAASPAAAVPGNYSGTFYITFNNE